MTVPVEGAIDFQAINRQALTQLSDLVSRWLPNGQRQGDEWTALNPCRADRRLGSFRINLRTGQWCDFALPDARGGDPISLLAYLENLSQSEAARHLAREFGRDE